MEAQRSVYSMGFPNNGFMENSVVWYEDPDGKRVEMPTNIAYCLAQRLLIRVAGTPGRAADVLADQPEDVPSLQVERVVQLKHVLKELA